jgi:hypothetical protein
LLNTTISTTIIPRAIHAHDTIPIQFSLWEDSLLITTESSGSVSETLATLGRDISLDCGTLDTSPGMSSDSKPDTVSDAAVEAEDATPAPVCFTVLDELDE